MMESGFLEQVSPFFSLLPFKGYNLFLYLTLHSISFKRFFFLFVAVGAKMGFFFFFANYCRSITSRIFVCWNSGSFGLEKVAMRLQTKRQ